jgi:hypothetical protein
MLKDGPLYACDCGQYFDVRKDEDQKLYEQCKLETIRKNMTKAQYLAHIEYVNNQKELVRKKEEKAKQERFRGIDEYGNNIYQLSLRL